jgi:hypothetical protein
LDRPAKSSSPKNAVLVTKKQKSNTAFEGENYLDNSELLKVMSEVKNGNFSIRLPMDISGCREAPLAVSEGPKAKLNSYLS